MGTQEGAGSRAVNHGKMLERLVEHCFATVTELTKTAKRTPPMGEGVWFARQLRWHNSIYHKPMIHDVFYRSETFPLGLIIELKWQSSPGSVYEKLPYTMLSLAGMPGTKILVADGPCHPEYALAWCRQYAALQDTLFMMSFTEFLTWAHLHIFD